MKDSKKQNILAGFRVENLDEDYVQALLEQQEETKPSRINNKIFNKNKRNKRDKYDEYDDE